MARTAQYSIEEIQKARHLRDHAATIADYRKALSVLLVAESDLSAQQAANILGTSRRSVFRNRHNICDQDGTSEKTWGGRRRSTMTIEQERAFLAQWEQKATEGGVLSVLPIHAALVEQLGHDIPMSTTYRLLARHGWRKIQPDTKHPKSDPAKQDEFKKNLRSCGCHQREKYWQSSTATDVPRRSPLWQNEQPKSMLGSGSPPANS